MRVHRGGSQLKDKQITDRIQKCREYIGRMKRPDTDFLSIIRDIETRRPELAPAAVDTTEETIQEGQDRGGIEEGQDRGGSFLSRLEYSLPDPFPPHLFQPPLSPPPRA